MGMLALVWGAVRTRTAQVLTVLILTALAAAVAAAAPWYAIAASTRAAAADVAAAPAAARALSVRKISDTGGDPRGTLDHFVSAARDLLALPTSEPVGGLVLPLTARLGGSTPGMAVAYRDGVCDHLLLDGPCPSAPGQVAVSLTAARQLGIGRGDPLELRGSPTAEPVALRVVATYVLADPTGPYWSDPLYAADAGFDPAYTPVETFEVRQLWEPTVTYDVQLADSMLRGDDGNDLVDRLRAADVRLGRSELRLVNPSGPLLDTVARDRSEIHDGVLVSLLQILILAWFAIGLAGRYTGRDRRGDAALLKLRGTTRTGMLRLAWGQHLVPLAFGALAGLPLGYLLARALTGPPVRPADRTTALLLSLAAAGAVLAGGLIVLAVLETLVLRHPVADLLRQVGAGRGDWRAALVDLLLLAVAVAGVYQARSGAAGAGLALAAPALVALAVALLLARLLGRAADRGGGVAVRTGRLRLGLTAVQVSRQPGTDRVFALVVVAVAGFVTALGGWSGERAARVERSAAELGATRVLTVQAANRTALLRAVRAADPAGDQAMAVAVDAASIPPVLAVDSARLAAVARWRPEYGPVGTLPAAIADQPGPAPLPQITGDRLTVRLRYEGQVPLDLALVLQHEGTGSPVRASFGPVRAGERTVAAQVAGCAVAPGCRILRWELNGPLPPGSAVTVRGLTQQNPAAVILDATSLADVSRWRSDTVGPAVDLAAAGGTLRMAVDADVTGLAEAGTEVYAVDTAMPLPVVMAGPPFVTWQFAEPTVTAFSGAPVPIRIARTVAALPVLGRTGVLVDFDAARRVAGDANRPIQLQVWLAPGASPRIVEALAAAGVRISGDDTVESRSGRLARQAPAVTTRFALLAGAVGLLLAAASIAVAGAVDRRARLEQLRALRVQGLPGRVAVGTAYAVVVAVVATGLLAGVLAAALADPLVRVTVPPFTDGWDVLAPPGALGAPALFGAAAIALVVLGLTGWLSVRPLIRHLRAEARR
jgi:hypothetical protein